MEALKKYFKGRVERTSEEELREKEEEIQRLKKYQEAILQTLGKPSKKILKNPTKF